MSLSVLYQNFLLAGEGNYQKSFKALPEVDQIAIYQKLLFKAGAKIKTAQVILNDLHGPLFQSELSPEVQDGIKREQQRYAVAKANAIYQEYLYQKVLSKAQEEDNLLFDPQGRLIYTLHLSTQEHEEVLKKIETELGLTVENRESKGVKVALNYLLGARTPTDTTLCSIDLTGKPPTQGEEAYKKIKIQYDKKFHDIAIIVHQRGSIVASFEETYAHMNLMARTYEHRSRTKDFDSLGKQIAPENWKIIRQKAALKLQDRVAEIYNQAVVNATKRNCTVDIEQLNKALVKERESLAFFAKKVLIEEMIDHLKSKGAGREHILSYMQNLTKRLDKKYTFTEQTATGYDYFHTSDYLQQGILITGTQDTAHHKPKFKENSEDQLAFRKVTYTYRDQKGELQPTTAVSARIPSPAIVFDKKMSPEAIKKDLADKYGFLHQQMTAMRGGKQGPVVENLFTSFHSNAFERTVDWNTNRQKTSVLYMMQAMHEFNAKQENDNFLYVQNIGTNRHTRDLGYRVDRSLGSITGSMTLDEITLSAEMAMLHTLNENSALLSPEIRKQVTEINTKILQHYRFYLKQENRPTYFAESEAGLALIAEIRTFKKEITKQLNTQERVRDLPSLISNALVKMIATNQHWDIRFGQLSQVLSMYLEWASTGGCKSGNERNQDVMLRFSLLKSIHERVKAGGGDKLQKQEQDIYFQLRAFAKGRTSNPDALRASIAVCVREVNTQGGPAAISREDQGGAAKVSSLSFVQDIKNPFLRWVARITLGVVGIATFPLLAIPAVRKFYASQLFDTNNAADREMNLDATGASKTQAHKGQDEQTRKAVFAVLDKDELFKEQKLNKIEKAEFEQDKELCESFLKEEHHELISTKKDIHLHDSALNEPKSYSELVNFRRRSQYTVTDLNTGTSPKNPTAVMSHYKENSHRSETENIDNENTETINNGLH